MKISSRQLKAFVLTARHRSFSRAAEQLFISQSGMSVLVRELETQLGFRLFDRTTRKVSLTEPGLRFLPIAARVAALAALERDRRTAPDRPAPGQPDPEGGRRHLAAFWPAPPAGDGFQLPRDADRDGGGGRGQRRAAELRHPGLPRLRRRAA